jgi:repressor LexA
MQKGLSKRQADILHFIRKKIHSECIPPSIQDICDEFGFSSTNGVHQHLLALEKKGYIERINKGASRAIRLINDKDNAINLKNNESNSTKQLNIVFKGNVENPVSIFMSSLGQIIVDKNYFNITEQSFAAIVYDDALFADGIHQDDLVIANFNSSPSNGDIVLALINDILLVRYYYKSGKEFKLQASTKGFPTMKFNSNEKSCAIIGTVSGLLRKIDTKK